MERSTARLVEIVRLLAETFELQPLMASIEAARSAVAGDQALEEALEALASIAIKRQRLVDAAAAKERLEREMTQARQIISALLPRPQRLQGYELAGWMRPASLTGGDLYDFGQLDEFRHFFLLADAAGHGLDSTLIVTKFRAYVRALLDGRPPLALSRRVNELLAEDCIYVTGFLGWVDRMRHTVHYVNAGQHPVLHVSAEQVRLLAVTGPPYGVDPDLAALPGPAVSLAEGDLLLAVSDGVTEWRNRSGEFYGDERLMASVYRARGLEAQELLEAVYADARAFSEGRAPGDDQTMVLVRRTQNQTLIRAAPGPGGRALLPPT